MLALIVGLRGNWPGGQFRRSVRAKVKDSTGEFPILRTLEFSSGSPREITDPDDLAAIEADLGKALLEMEAMVEPPRVRAKGDVAAAGDVIGDDGAHDEVDAKAQATDEAKSQAKSQAKSRPKRGE